MAYLPVFCRLLVGGLFAVSVLAKLRDPPSFRAALRGYHLLPRWAETPAVAVVLATEALVPVLLIFAATALVGFALAAGLLAVFAAAMLSVLRRGLAADCGCVGRRGSTVRLAHVWRNLTLVFVCLAGAATTLFAGGRVEPSVVIVLAAAAGCAVATLVFLDDLLLLFTAPAGRNRP